MTTGKVCIECGDTLTAERAGLGYGYCTKPECQAVHYRGLSVTTVGMNKSADAVIVADPAEISRRGEAGELAKKDTGLGLDFRSSAKKPAERAAATSTRAPAPKPRSTPRPWTAQQEKIVRLYHGMGLAPRQIVERAGETSPRLQITERLAVRILSSPPPGRRH